MNNYGINSNSELDCDLMFKILLLGDSGVGKSNLLLRYTKDQFMVDMRSTIGVEFGIKMLKLDGLEIKVQIWDTAGMERYRAITSSYYKGAKGAIVIYDISRKSSFDNVDNWIDDFKSKADDDAIVLLVGNKNDLIDQRQVDKEEALLKAQKNKLAFMETSAKENDNVQAAFVTLFQAILNKFKEVNGDLLNNDNLIKGNNQNSNHIKSKKGGSITGMSGGYAIHIDTIDEDNYIEEEGNINSRKCC